MTCVFVYFRVKKSRKFSFLWVIGGKLTFSFAYWPVAPGGMTGAQLDRTYALNPTTRQQSI